MSAYYILTFLFNSQLTTSTVFSYADFNKPGTVICCKMKIREKLMSACPAVVPRLFLNSCRGLRAWRLKHKAFSITLPDHIYFVVSVRNSVRLMFISMVLREFKANSSHTYLQGVSPHFNDLSITSKQFENHILSNENHLIWIAESCHYFRFLFRILSIFYVHICLFEFVQDDVYHQAILTYESVHRFARIDVQTTGMYYIHHLLTLYAYRLKRCIIFIRCRDKPPCTVTYGKEDEERDILWNLYRIWSMDESLDSLHPSPWLLFTQREAKIYPSSRRLWCVEPGCHAKPHARRSWLCCPRWRSAALMEDLLLQSAHGWRGCALRCVWSWAALRLETFCLHMLTDVHHASWQHCVGSLRFWLFVWVSEYIKIVISL